jgi:hypothetical protein
MIAQARDRHMRRGRIDCSRAVAAPDLREFGRTRAAALSTACLSRSSPLR